MLLLNFYMISNANKENNEKHKDLTPCIQSFSWGPIVAQLVKKFPRSIQLKGSLMCSQKPVTASCSKEDEYSSHAYI
jgi:hypothetical protein